MYSSSVLLSISQVTNSELSKIHQASYRPIRVRKTIPPRLAWQLQAHFTIENVPILQSYQEVVTGLFKNVWKNAIHEELD